MLTTLILFAAVLTLGALTLYWRRRALREQDARRDAWALLAAISIHCHFPDEEMKTARRYAEHIRRIGKQE